MIKLRKFQTRDTKDAAFLIFKTFKRFNSAEYFRKSAIDEYLDRYNLEKNPVEKLFKGNSIFYLAVKNDKIVGLIRGNPDRIANLFVDGKKHKKGIGKKLLFKFEREAVKKGSSEIKTRASLYAIPFYQKMGYKKSTGVRNFKGLKVCPLRKILLF